MKLKISAGSFSGGVVMAAAIIVTYTAPAQDIYVASYNDGTIYNYTVGGTLTSSYPGVSEPEGIAFDNSGNLYVASSGGNAIDKITTGGAVSFFASIPDPNTVALAVSTAGYLFASGYNSGDIYKISSGGAVSTFLTGLSTPCSMAFDSSGDLFFLSQNNHTIYECQNVGGTLSTSYTVFAAGLAPGAGGIAFNGAGNMFVGNVSNILEFTTSGHPSTFATGLDGPSTLAFDTNGNLFATESGINEVVKIASDGSESDFATVANCTGVAVQGVVLPVPEPSTWAVAGLGGVVLLWRGVKRGI